MENQRKITIFAAVKQNKRMKVISTKKRTELWAGVVFIIR